MPNECNYWYSGRKGNLCDHTLELRVVYYSKRVERQMELFVCTSHAGKMILKLVKSAMVDQETLRIYPYAD
jgi:hypothetical protein